MAQTLGSKMQFGFDISIFVKIFLRDGLESKKKMRPHPASRRRRRRRSNCCCRWGTCAPMAGSRRRVGSRTGWKSRVAATGRPTPAAARRHPQHQISWIACFTKSLFSLTHSMTSLLLLAPAALGALQSLPAPPCIPSVSRLSILNQMVHIFVHIA